MRSFVSVAAFGLVALGLCPQVGLGGQALAGSDDIVLAVSYFDNLAKDASSEALTKGLAEMMVTG